MAKDNNKRASINSGKDTALYNAARAAAAADGRSLSSWICRLLKQRFDEPMKYPERVTGGVSLNERAGISSALKSKDKKDTVAAAAKADLAKGHPGL
jgi:hypothetical protein